jgi:hypothetical protein
MVEAILEPLVEEIKVVEFQSDGRVGGTRRDDPLESRRNCGRIQVGRTAFHQVETTIFEYLQITIDRPFLLSRSTIRARG